MRHVRWPWLALSTLPGAALLLMRQEPLAAYWPALLLLLLPWAGRFRLTVFVGVALLCWMAWIYQQQWHDQIVGAPVDVQLRGLISGAVSERNGALHFAFQVDEPEQALHERRLRVAWYRDAPQIAEGDCWQLDLRLREAHGFSNPGGMDYEAWLFREAYAGRASVRAGTRCGVAEPGLRPRLREILLGARSGRAAATVSALLLGDRSDLQDQDWTILRHTGTSHLFAISGLHVGLIAALGWGLGVLLWKGLLYRLWPRQRDLAVLLALLAALSYALLSGFAVPVQRALIMCLLGLLALYTGRAGQGFSMLALAWVLVLAVNPLSVMMPGLWLSFVAVAGILLYLQCWKEQPHWQQLIGIQLMLGLLLLPLSVLFFGGFSLIAAPINLLLVPLFSLLLPALLLAALCQLAGWNGPLDTMHVLLEGMWQMLAAAAEAPQAFVSLPAPSWWGAACACLGALLWVLRSWWSRGLGSLLFLPWLLATPGTPEPGAVQAWFFDVGQGQSILLQTAHHQLLYDAGPAWPGGFDAGERLVVPALQALKVKQIDRLLISHGDSDHVGGLQAVQGFLPVKQVLGGAERPCQAGESWQWDGVRFAIVHPEPGSDWSDNNGSCVLQVTTRSGRSLLLTGDIEQAAELRLLQAGLPQQTVISVPHHGSASSSSVPFVTRVRPQLAVVSAGHHNRWGHPRPEVTARYRQAGSRMVNLSESGALRVQLDEDLHWQSWRQSQSRLWRGFGVSNAR